MNYSTETLIGKVMTSTQSVLLSYCRQQQMLILRTKSGSRHHWILCL